MTVCYVALGGNVGDVGATFQGALEELGRLPHTVVSRASRFFAFPAIGPQAGGSFLNAAAELQVADTPHALLERLQGVEARFGRARGMRWGPRTLDLDLIFFGSAVIDEPGLVVPHPACWYRRFVLDPLTELAGDFVHPVKSVTVRTLRARLLQRPLTMALAGGSRAVRSTLIDALARRFPDARFVDWNSAPQNIDSQPTIIAWLGESIERNVGSDTLAYGDLDPVARLDASSHADDFVEFLAGVVASAISPPIESPHITR